MYMIEKMDFGYVMSLFGPVGPEEMHRCFRRIRQDLRRSKGKFCFWADCRELSCLEPELLQEWDKGQEYFRGRGLERCVVLLSDPDMTQRFKQLAVQAGRAEWERCIDASAGADWIERGVDWITRSLDPER